MRSILFCIRIYKYIYYNLYISDLIYKYIYYNLYISDLIYILEFILYYRITKTYI